MYWLQSPPWGRWFLAAALVVAALWSELRPESTTGHPFASTRILTGESIDAGNTEMRKIPVGLLESISVEGVAIREIAPGSPLLAADVVDRSNSIPTTWWIVEVEVPPHVRRGDDVKVVLLDTGEVIDGVLAFPASDDPFGTGNGGVALPPERASDVAVAAASSRVAVLVSAG
ncbi:MAG: hypothetical protein U9N56_10630 [Actinomycetota bacterium]|nr:hypothetical protein [Actinomycetota bacterium]